MKKIALLIATTLSVTTLAACSSNTTSAKPTVNSSPEKVTHHYKYYSKGQTFYSNKGSMKVNKLIGYTVKGKKYFLLDVTYKNTSKKALDSTEIMSPNIEVFQLNHDKSQKVSLSGSSATDYYNNDDNSDNYDRLSEITDSSANKLMPGKESRTIMEFSYALNNTENVVELRLNDPNAISKETVNPKKNNITINSSDIEFNTLNLNDYSH